MTLWWTSMSGRDVARRVVGDVDRAAVVSGFVFHEHVVAVNASRAPANDVYGRAVPPLRSVPDKAIAFDDAGGLGPDGPAVTC